MSFALFRRNIMQLVKPMLVIVMVLAMYTGVIIYMFDPDIAKILDEYQKMLPTIMSAAGMSGAASTLLEFIKTYLYGFLMLLFPMIFSVIAGNVLLMKYEDNSSITCLLSTPVSRKKIILTQIFSMITGVIILMTIITILGIAFSEAMFKGELDISKYIFLNVAACILHLAIASIAFVTACIFNESKYYYSIGLGIPLISFLANALANMGDKLSGFKYISIYTLFPVDEIVSKDGNTIDGITVLSLIAVVLFSIGGFVFVRKDVD